MDFEELLDTQAINYDDVIPSRIYLALSVYSLMLLFLIKMEKQQNFNLSNMRKHAKLYSFPVPLNSSFPSKPLYTFLQTFTKCEVGFFFYYKRERLKISFSFFFFSPV